MPPEQALRCAPAPGASYFIPAVYLLSCILPVPAPAQYGQGNGSQAGQRQETDPEAGCLFFLLFYSIINSHVCVMSFRYYFGRSGIFTP